MNGCQPEVTGWTRAQRIISAPSEFKSPGRCGVLSVLLVGKLDEMIGEGAVVLVRAGVGILVEKDTVCTGLAYCAKRDEGLPVRVGGRPFAYMTMG